MNSQSTTINEYIELFPVDVQVKLTKIRQTIHMNAPKAIEAMRYQMPTFRLHEKNLIHFAAFKHHIGLYPSPSAIVAFTKELTCYKTSKGAIQFPIDGLIPYDLITKIVQFRVKEMSNK